MNNKRINNQQRQTDTYWKDFFKYKFFWNGIKTAFCSSKNYWYKKILETRKKWDLMLPTSNKFLNIVKTSPCCKTEYDVCNQMGVIPLNKLIKFKCIKYRHNIAVWTFDKYLEKFIPKILKSTLFLHSKLSCSCSFQCTTAFTFWFLLFVAFFSHSLTHTYAHIYNFFFSFYIQLHTLVYTIKSVSI